MSRLEQNLCRFCMSTERLQDIYSKNDHNLFIQRVYFCTSLKVRPEDNLPIMICEYCVRQIEEFTIFKLECLRVNEQLKLEWMKSDLELTKSEPQNDPGDILLTDTYPIQLFQEDPNPENNFDADEGHYLMFKQEPAVSKNKNKCVESSIQNDLSQSNIKPDDRMEVQSDSIFQRNDVHKNTKLFPCDHCQKSFTRAETKRIHIRSHHLGIKPYICEVCGQSSTKKQDLKRHMIIHSEERNHQCYLCQQFFKRKSDLVSHERTHTKARPYKCKLCDKDYTSHSGLRKHNAIHCL